jgi:hypothetical protein
MIELDNRYAGLLKDISDEIKISEEVITIKDKYYIESDMILAYLDELFSAYLRLKENYEILQSTCNENTYDRFYERGGFPL